VSGTYLSSDCDAYLGNKPDPVEWKGLGREMYIFTNKPSQYENDYDNGIKDRLMGIEWQL